MSKANFPTTPKEQFYKDLLKITEKAMNENVPVEDLMEILTLHGLNTFMRDSDNSFCCATDVLLQILSQWYTSSHEQSMSSSDEDDCLCGVSCDDDEKNKKTMH